MSEVKLPMISIVTPCLNSEKYIAEAVESVLAQDYPAFEHIVVDGASRDRTLDILRRYPHLKVLSEPDENLYDALNKGIALAGGVLVGWLNADDVYPDGVLWAVADTWREDRSLDLVCGHGAVFESTCRGKALVRRLPFTPQESFRTGAILHHATLLNACFLSRSLLRRLGAFSIAYAIGADKEYLLRIASSRPHIRVLNSLAYQYRRHDASLTFASHIPPTERLKRVEDNMIIYSQYLRRKPIPVAVRRHCRRQLRRRALTGIKLHFARGGVSEALRVVGKMLALDPLWPFWVLYRCLQQLGQHAAHATRILRKPERSE